MRWPIRTRDVFSQASAHHWLITDDVPPPQGQWQQLPADSRTKGTFSCPRSYHNATLPDARSSKSEWVETYPGATQAALVIGYWWDTAHILSCHLGVASAQQHSCSPVSHPTKRKMGHEVHFFPPLNQVKLKKLALGTIRGRRCS